MTGMTEDLRADVRNVVEEVLSHDSNEKRREELEKHMLGTQGKLEAAAKKIAELTEVSQAKDEEIASLESQVAKLTETKTTELAEKDESLSAKTAELESLATEKSDKIAELEKELEGARIALANIEKDRAVEARFTELKKVSVAFTGKDAAAAQLTKVRDMSDEEFASYKGELVALLEQSKAASASPEEVSQETSEEEVPPPAINNESAGAPGNVELGSAKSNHERVGNLGELMSQYINTNMKKDCES